MNRTRRLQSHLNTKGEVRERDGSRDLRPRYALGAKPSERGAPEEQRSFGSNPREILDVRQYELGAYIIEHVTNSNTVESNHSSKSSELRCRLQHPIQ